MSHMFNKPSPKKNKLSDLSAINKPYLVESILKKELRGGQPFYLIKWKGFPKSHSSWEPLCNLSGRMHLVEQFERRKSATSGLEEIKEAGASKEISCGPDASSSPRIIGMFIQPSTGTFTYAVYYPENGLTMPHIEIMATEVLRKSNPKLLISYLEEHISL